MLCVYLTLNVCRLLCLVSCVLCVLWVLCFCCSSSVVGCSLCVVACCRLLLYLVCFALLAHVRDVCSLLRGGVLFVCRLLFVAR